LRLGATGDAGTEKLVFPDGGRGHSALNMQGLDRFSFLGRVAAGTDIGVPADIDAVKAHDGRRLQSHPGFPDWVSVAVKNTLSWAMVRL
jgi:hypothetical protein